MYLHIIIMHYTYIFTIIWRLLHLIHAGVSGNCTRIGMSQYQGIIYDMWHYSLNVYVPEREWNRLTMRL